MPFLTSQPQLLFLLAEQEDITDMLLINNTPRSNRFILVINSVFQSKLFSKIYISLELPNISSLYVSAYKPVILVAPMDWGLGHTTRCIPLISILKSIGCEVITAGTAETKMVFQREFPGMEHLMLPSYGIRYGHGNNALGWRFLGRMPKILTKIKEEREVVRTFTEKRQVHGIISDNRFGCYHSKIPSVFITHQLSLKTPLGGPVDALATRINLHLVNRFQQVWIPDNEQSPSLAGTLAHPERTLPVPALYGGPLTRLQKLNTAKTQYRFLFLLSGPEPQRSIFEALLRQQSAQLEEEILLVRGIANGSDQIVKEGHLHVVDFADSTALSSFLAASEMVVARSGYTTVMDLASLGKKALFVPTPGQTEQEYLAKHLSEQGLFFSTPQKDFHLQNAVQKAETFYRDNTGSIHLSSRWEAILQQWVNSLMRN